MSTYYNLVYNLRFDELPLREEIDRESIETIREMEPFTIELPGKLLNIQPKQSLDA